MSAELHTHHVAAPAPRRTETVPAVPPPDRRRPTVSGDLPSVLDPAPMFRRAVVGYDCFQVDTYVQWAEDELATAEREREHLLARVLRTQADLDEARELLSHSSSGADFLGASRRIGSLLAAAADEASGMKAEAEALRTAAATQAAQIVAEGARALADARLEAERLVAAAAGQAAEILDEARQTRRRARAEAAAWRETARAFLRRAVEQAERIGADARAEAAAARAQARGDILQMLAAGREERRRADDRAAVARARLDREATARWAFLQAEVAELERARTDLERAVATVATVALRPHVRGYVDRFRTRPVLRARLGRAAPRP